MMKYLFKCNPKCDPGLETTPPPPGNNDIMVPMVYPYPPKELPTKGQGWHFFLKGGDTCQVGDDLKKGVGVSLPWDTMRHIKFLGDS